MKFKISFIFNLLCCLMLIISITRYINLKKESKEEQKKSKISKQEDDLSHIYGQLGMYIMFFNVIRELDIPTKKLQQSHLLMTLEIDFEETIENLQYIRSNDSDMNEFKKACYERFLLYREKYPIFINKSLRTSSKPSIRLYDVWPDTYHKPILSRYKIFYQDTVE